MTAISATTNQTSNATSHSTQLRTTSNAKTTETSEKVAARLGGEVDKLEKQLFAAYEKPDLSEKTIKKLEMQYKNAMLALEGFMQLMRSKHETIMRGIQNLMLR